MILPIHIAIATFSLIFTGYTFFSPTKAKLNVSYSLIALVFVTGFYLVFTKPANLVQTCTTGLVYLGVMLAGTFATRRKLARQAEKIQ